MCPSATTLNRQGRARDDAPRRCSSTDTGFDFARRYRPGAVVVAPYPREDVDFDRRRGLLLLQLGAVLPPAVRHRDPAERRTSSSRRPATGSTTSSTRSAPATTRPPPQRYWNTKPFFQATAADYLAQRIDTIMDTLAADPTGATIERPAVRGRTVAEPSRSSRTWSPARAPVAFQLAIVIKYVAEPDRLGRQPVPPVHPRVGQPGDAAVHPGGQAARRRSRGIVPPAVPAAGHDLQPAARRSWTSSATRCSTWRT